MAKARLTARHAWAQLALGLCVGLAVGGVLLLLGAKAPWMAIPAAGLWATPWIEQKTTGRRPSRQCSAWAAATGATIGYLIFEATRWM